MPRNGDGSGDSGPHEGHEILHGTNGDVRRCSISRLWTRVNLLISSQETLQHTKHVAPMPKHEDGDGMAVLPVSMTLAYQIL